MNDFDSERVVSLETANKMKGVLDIMMDKCPHIVTRGAGDVSMDYCEITEKPSGRIRACLLVSDSYCEEWEQIQREWQEEGK